MGMRRTRGDVFFLTFKRLNLQQYLGFLADRLIDSEDVIIRLDGELIDG